jgi:integrase
MSKQLTAIKPNQIAPIAHTAQLHDEDAQRVAAALAASAAGNTLRTYTSQWRKFTAWCAQRGYGSLPAQSESVAAYLAGIGNTNARYVARAAIRQAHRIAQQPDPTGSAIVTSASKGAGRIAAAQGKREHKAHPLSADDLQRIIGHLDAHADDTSERDAVLLACGWWSACRRSELAAWRAEDVTFSPDGASVLIAQSKTDQSAAGQYVYLPQHAAARLKAFIGPRGNGYVFCTRPVTRNTSRREAGCIDGRDVARILKRRAAEAGIENASRLSGHSLRRGFVTDRRAHGATLADIAEQTRHRSLDTLRGYDDAQSASVKRLLSL